MSKDNSKCAQCECCGNGDDMSEFEQYMAKKWGSPRGIAIVLASLSFSLVSLGVFLWLLHLANIIR